MLSLYSSCLVSSFFNEMSKAALEFELVSRYLAAAAAFSKPDESKP